MSTLKQYQQSLLLLFFVLLILFAGIREYERFTQSEAVSLLRLPS